MKALVTGARGTVGSVLCQLMQQRQMEVVHWNRQIVPIDDYQRMEDFVQEVSPDVLFHLAYDSKRRGSIHESWKINFEWPGQLAWITRKLNVKFLFTSTNLVFSKRKKGPFLPGTIPEEENGYGYEKRMAEDRVLYQNRDAIIARLGWQIGINAGSNNMMDYLQRQIDESGMIQANINWKPACSFLTDTCEVLLELAIDFSPSVYMIDANREWNFFEIASALKQLHNNDWKIIPVQGEDLDNRMIDQRIKINSLKGHLFNL